MHAKAFKLSDLATRQLPPNGLRNPRYRIIKCEWLVKYGAVGNTPYSLLVVAIACRVNDGNAWADIAYAPSDRPAVHPRHPDIGD